MSFIVDLVLDEVLDAGCSLLDTVVSDVHDVVGVRRDIVLLGRTDLLTLAVLVRHMRQSLQETFVLLEELLVFVNTVVDTLLVDVPLRFFDVGAAVFVVELEDVPVVAFELCLHFQVDHFGVVDSDWALLGLVSHHFVD